MNPSMTTYRLSHLVQEAVVLLVLLGSCWGCAGIQPPNIHHYTLHYDPPGQGREGPVGPLVLQVERFGTAPPYNTTKLVYATDDFGRNMYVSHQWRAIPGELIAYYLARDLRSSGIFKAVAGPESRLPADRVLSGSVDELLEMEEATGCSAIVGVTVTLLEAGQPDVSKRVVFQKSYRQRVPAARRTAGDLVAAFSSAVQLISRELAADIRNHTN
uniref:ABC-type transport auxiliary lipoprotein component domain-containing protein n=1 Tax=Desulfatirhabdium butyrativorans TaxID=340467 RepID=A0A7C4MRA7_9BACT